MTAEIDSTKRERFNALRAQLDRLGHTAEVKPHCRPGLSADEVRRLIRKQKRAAKPSSAPAQAILYRRDLPRTSPTKPAGGDHAGPHIELERAIEGHELAPVTGGKLFVVTRRVSDIEGAAPINEVFRTKLADPGSGLCQALAMTSRTPALTPDDIVFMDVESTGLGSSPLFLVGVMLWEGDGFEVRQYLARTYAEEAAVVATFLDTCRPRALLVTFNGKSFDFPFVRARAAATGVPFDVNPAHFDLLHVCRRVWKNVLPDCKLQTLEARICRRVRYGDIPGCDIPDAYHHFVRTGNARRIADILKHNMLDLITLADLMTRLPEAAPAGGVRTEHER